MPSSSVRVVTDLAAVSIAAAPRDVPKRGAGAFGLALTLLIIVGAAFAMRRARRLVE